MLEDQTLHPNFESALLKRGIAVDISVLHFLRPAAVKLGVYWEGIGFHAFRHEAVTEYSGSLGIGQAQRMAGHSTVDMSLHYTLADQQAQEQAVRALQQRVRGNVVEIRKGA